MSKCVSRIHVVAIVRRGQKRAGGLPYNVNGVGQINEVALRWARLVLGWVNVSGFNSRSWKFISV